MATLSRIVAGTDCRTAGQQSLKGRSMTVTESSPALRYDVGGVLLDRPFKIRRLGHFGFNVDHVAEALHFYSDLLGFMVSDESSIGTRLPPEERASLGDTAGYFTRHGGDHHSFVLFPRQVL